MRIDRIGIAAFLALLAPAAPWLMVASLAAHLADHAAQSAHAAHSADHAHPAPHGHARPLALALHGHPHSPGTPDHEHAVVTVNPAPPRGKASPATGPAGCVRVDADVVPQAPGRLPAAIGPNHGPPAVLLPSPTLRI